MFKVGVHINNVKQAIMNEGLDPSKIEVNFHSRLPWINLNNHASYLLTSTIR